MMSHLRCFTVIACIDILYVFALPTNNMIDLNGHDMDSVKFDTLKCPENEYFNDLGKACELTCENPIHSNSCSEKKVVACECEFGYVRNSTGACVTLDQCGYDNFKISSDEEKNSFKSESSSNGTEAQVPDNEIPEIFNEVFGEAFNSTIDEIEETLINELIYEDNTETDDDNNDFLSVNIDDWVPMIF